MLIRRRFVNHILRYHMKKKIIIASVVGKDWRKTLKRC